MRFFIEEMSQEIFEIWAYSYFPGACFCFQFSHEIESACLLSRVTNTIGCCQSSLLKQELPPPLISKTFLQP